MLLYLDKSICLPIFFLSGFTFIILDIGRIKYESINKIYSIFFASITKKTENQNLTGASFTFIGLIIVTIFFPAKIAAISVIIMSISDGLASLVGFRFGYIKILDKSLEGSLVFFISACIILILFGYTSISVIVIALCCTIIELIASKTKVDDNLLIQISVAVILSII
jgi:dolichol kinase